MHEEKICWLVNGNLIVPLAFGWTSCMYMIPVRWRRMGGYVLFVLVLVNSYFGLHFSTPPFQQAACCNLLVLVHFVPRTST